MARVIKKGLEYFPMDVDFFQDIRIRKLIKRQGGKAVTVYALLLCIIYKNGYYIRWDKELPFICSEFTGFGEAYISETIKCCISLGLFDKNMFDTEGILTSKGIQVRYKIIQGSYKRVDKVDRYKIDTDAEYEPGQAEQATDKPKLKLPVATSSRTETMHVTATMTAPKQGGNQQWLTDFFKKENEDRLNVLCMQFRLGNGNIATLKKMADTIVNEWELTQTTHSDFSDWSRHLISCMRIKNNYKSENKRELTPPPPNDYTYTDGFGSKDI